MGGGRSAVGGARSAVGGARSAVGGAQWANELFALRAPPSALPYCTTTGIVNAFDQPPDFGCTDKSSA